MLIQYRIQFEQDGITITQTVDPGDQSGIGQGGGNGSGIGPGGGNGSGIGPGGGNGSGIGPGGGNGSSIGPGGGNGSGIGPGGGNGSGIGPGGGNGSGIGPGGSLLGTGRVVILGPLVIEGTSGTSTGQAYTPPRVKPGAQAGYQPLALRQFHLQKQKMTNWCWAAVSVSVERFFDPESHLRQCDMIERVGPKLQGCCADPTPGGCDKTALLQDALRDRIQQAQKGPLGFDKVQEQIDSQLPVCARIGWDGGSEKAGHFVVIAGYGRSPNGQALVHVLDPFFRSGLWPYSALVSAGYQRRNGQWTDTFLFKR